MAKTEEFRDHIPTVSADGKSRKWIYPRLIKGRLYQYRNGLSWFLMVLLFTAPYIRLNGEQLVLLNVLERKFVFFGILFMPQDFHLFVLAMLSFVVFVVLFTVVFGRVWCGWACPQTIFMEMLFRRIERWIEGEGEKQKKFHQSPMSFNKAIRKGAKHLIFLLISFFISNTFLAYLIGSDQLIRIIREPIAEHVVGFVAIWIFTGVFYLVFAYVRELVCTVICPYGRLQGVLLDKQSMVVAYDYVRGEPRGHVKKGQEQKVGDCVDCDLCVQVCPTGIDIRNGTQLECVNCAVCIDACDSVMRKLNRQERLIGFYSEEQIEQGKKFKLNRRAKAYIVVFIVIFSLFGYFMMNRVEVEATILRANGTLYQLREDGSVSNLYFGEFVNKTTHPVKIQLVPKDPDTKVQFITPLKELKKGEAAKFTFFIIKTQKNIKKFKTELHFDLVSENRILDQVETSFVAPAN